MTKPEPALPAAPAVQVIERIFALIDILASREEAMSLKEISEKSGLHPSTAHRILNDLTSGRYVDRPEPGQYRLGMRLLELGNLVKARLNVRDAALEPMRELPRSRSRHSFQSGGTGDPTTLHRKMQGGAKEGG